jgi:DNA-binding transcriptional regulator YhcF (GntR family)
MEKEIKRHIELPTTEGISDITPQDQLVYLGIRSFMNKDTLEAFPSQETIAERVGCCRNTVRKCIQNLVEKDYLKIRTEGRKQIYIFNKLKQFEPFSYEFLEDKSKSFTKRATLAATQRYMTGKETGVGKVTYTKMELAKLINTPYSTLVRTLRELTEDGLIVNKKLPSGQQQMQFQLEKYHQGIVKILLNHEERIEAHEERIEANEDDIQILKTENKEFREENLELQRKYKELESRLNELENKKKPHVILD